MLGGPAGTCLAAKNQSESSSYLTHKQNKYVSMQPGMLAPETAYYSSEAMNSSLNMAAA